MWAASDDLAERKLYAVQQVRHRPPRRVAALRLASDRRPCSALAGDRGAQGGAGLSSSRGAGLAAADGENRAEH